MEKWRLPLLLLWLTAGFVINAENTAEDNDNAPMLKNLTNNHLDSIPRNENNASVINLVIEENLITLTDDDQIALAGYPTLVELHLDSNQVTAIPAKHFSVLPNLRVLSLSRNNISSLDPEAFSGLHALTVLDLSWNQLTSLPTQMITELNSLQTLMLHGNPWNCSCPLLRAIGEIKAANVTIGGSTATCASPAEQVGKDLLEATALCSPSPTSTMTTHTQHPPTPNHFQQSWSSSTLRTTTLSSSQNRTVTVDQTPVLGNTWKFTSCIIALALTTLMLIICAIKGPSWYRLFHNYRHRVLREEDGQEEDFEPNVFSGTGPRPSHQTFTFVRHNRHTDEEEGDEDVYFEDPYIKSEE